MPTAAADVHRGIHCGIDFPHPVHTAAHGGRLLRCLRQPLPPCIQFRGERPVRLRQPDVNFVFVGSDLIKVRRGPGIVFLRESVALRGCQDESCLRAAVPIPPSSGAPAPAEIPRRECYC